MCNHLLILVNTMACKPILKAHTLTRSRTLSYDDKVNQLFTLKSLVLMSHVLAWFKKAPKLVTQGRAKTPPEVDPIGWTAF